MSTSFVNSMKVESLTFWGWNMLSRVCLIAVALTSLGALELSAQHAPDGRLRSNASVRVVVDSQTPLLLPRDAQQLTRGRRAKKGAIIGAVTLGVLGMLATSQMATGCDVSSGNSGCTTSLTRAGFAAYGLVLGATVGGISGGVIGFAWPLARTSRSETR